MNNLKEKLKKNLPTIGSWVTIGHPSIVEIMATAGFEWLTIDLEHSAIDISKAMELITVIQANDMAALVRVSKNEEVVIKRVLDAGADGVIVPMVRTVEDAQQAVDIRLSESGASDYAAHKNMVSDLRSTRHGKRTAQ